MSPNSTFNRPRVAPPSLACYTDRQVAKRYARNRPLIHATALEAFRIGSGVTEDFDSALDVACGTGQSSVALREHSQEVVGADVSVAMLLESERADGIRYVYGAAEHLPLEAKTFQIVCVGLGFHWFQQGAFLAEASRVLEPDGWLVIYNSWFSGKARSAPDFAESTWRAYLKRFPSPPRHSPFVTERSARAHGFELCGGVDFEDWVEFSRRELEAYFTTQSNVVRAVEEGRQTLESAKAAVRALVRNGLDDSLHEFQFPGHVMFLRRRGSGPS